MLSPGAGADAGRGGLCSRPLVLAVGSTFSTVHAIAAAKAATTIDHISGGRFGRDVRRSSDSTTSATRFGQEWLDYGLYNLPKLTVATTGSGTGPLAAPLRRRNGCT
jgi:hypothetical protein